MDPSRNGMLGFGICLLAFACLLHLVSADTSIDISSPCTRNSDVDTNAERLRQIKEEKSSWKWDDLSTPESGMMWFHKANTNPDFMKEAIVSKTFMQASITKLVPDPSEDKSVKGDLYFVTGSRNVVAGKMGKGFDSDLNHWEEVPLDTTTNKPFVLVRNVVSPFSSFVTLTQLNSIFEFAVVLDKVKIYNVRNQSVYEKYMQDVRWNPLVQMRNVMVPSRNSSDVIRVYVLSSMDFSVSIKFAISGESLEERNGGVKGFLTPRSSFIWVHIRHMNPDFLTTYNAIELELHICAAGDSSLVNPKDPASNDHDSFVSIEQDVSRSRWDSNKAYGYVSWGDLLQHGDQHTRLDIQQVDYSRDPVRTRSPRGLLSSKNGECTRLRLTRRNAGTLRQYANPVDLTWGFAIGIGKIPPAIITWKTTLFSIIVAVFGIGAAMWLIIWYARRIQRIDILTHQDSLGGRSLSSSARKDFPSPLSNQIQMRGGYGSTTADIIRKGSDHPSQII